MAYVQRITPPPNRVLNFSLKDFSGGMNNRSDQIGDNEGAVLDNLMFSDDTILETRYGQKYFDEKVVDGEIIFIDEYRPYREANMLVRATMTKMYFGDIEVPITGRPSGANHFGRYYFSDGSKLRVFANFTNTVAGENPITQSEEALPIAEEGEPPIEVVEYHKAIGTPIAGYAVYEVISPPIDHVRLPKQHIRGVTVVNYTDKTVYYEPCANEFEDTTLGACVVPENVKYIVSHTGRLFVSGHDDDDDNVFISDLHNPLYYAVSLPLQIPPSSDKVIGLHVFDNCVIVGRQYDIYAIFGSSNNPQLGVDVFQLKRLNTHTGFASHAAVNIAHNYLMFLGSDGNAYAIQNARVNQRELSTVILSRTIDLSRYPVNVDKEEYSEASSAFFNDEWHLSIGDKTMVYSYRKMAWTMYSGLKAKCWYGLNGEWLWGRPEGRIAMFDKDSFFDFGEPYQSLWYSKIFDMDDANSFKQFREFFLVAHTFEQHYSDIYVTFEVDYANVKDRAVISNQVARWGMSKWGDRFVNKNINESVPFVIGRRGRNIRFLVTNGYPLDGMVADYSELEHYPGKRDNLLVKVGADKYYIYIKREWVLLESEALNQRMKIYQINGDYEMRGKR